MLTRSQTAKAAANASANASANAIVKKSVKNNISYQIVTRSRSRLVNQSTENIEPVRRSTRISKMRNMMTSEQQEEEEEPVRRSERISNMPKPVYEVHISFDEASEAWMANKKRLGNGMYEYIE
jgi:hypothetical protein